MCRWFEMAVGMLLIVTASLVISACKVSKVESGQVMTVAAPAQPANSLETSVRDYKSWKLVNPQPMTLNRTPPVPPGGAVAGTLCADPVAPLDNPHVDKFISVYVNNVGVPAMMAEAHPQFPPGSIIVKEKRDTVIGAPVMMTVMVKHDKGYAAVRGDWEFLVMDGGATKLVKPERAASCWACHAGYEQTDFVTRVYLPEDVKAQLR